MKNLIENELISETEIMELIQTTFKLVKLGVLDKKYLNMICEKTDVKQLSENEFQFDENSIYKFN